MALKIDPNLQECDDFYEALLAAHKGLGPDEVRAFHARLILVLANHVGDIAALREALELAGDEDSSRGS